MRGEFNGLKAKTSEENSSSYYAHCFSHQQKQVIVAKKMIILMILYITSTLFNVVGGPCKRKDMIRENIERLYKQSYAVETLVYGKGYIKINLFKYLDTRC